MTGGDDFPTMAAGVGLVGGISSLAQGALLLPSTSWASLGWTCPRSSSKTGCTDTPYHSIPLPSDTGGFSQPHTTSLPREALGFLSLQEGWSL